MGYCIASCEAQIVGSYEDLAVLYDDAADGTFTEIYGLFRFLDRFEHEAFLV